MDKTESEARKKLKSRNLLAVGRFQLNSQLKKQPGIKCPNTILYINHRICVMLTVKLIHL